MLKKTVLAGIALLSLSAVALADSKIGAINIQKILADAPQAARAKKKIEKDFEVRDQELQRIAKQLKFGDLSREFERKRREFREDLSQRQNEEMAAIFERVNKIVKQLAEAEKYDIIFQEAAYVNPRIDITDKVIKALGDGGK